MSFARFNVESQIFFRSARSFGLVNLKPIVPGHVLVIPRRVVSRLGELSVPELNDLFESVQRVTRVLQDAYDAQGTTVSLQDGPVAGQSVPHVHVHVLPRRAGDLAHNDDVYARLDTDSATLQRDWDEALRCRPAFTPVDDDDRKPRTMADMEAEASWLSTFFTTQ